MSRSTNELSARLSAKSRETFYDVYKRFDWVEKLSPDRMGMTPEFTTLAGTDIWSDLTDEQKWKLTIHETGNLFSNTLNGERLLCAGLSTQLYSKPMSPEITDYLHHFLDEENKHMVMFGMYCQKYCGRVYPEKKIPLPRDYAPGEELISFYALAMVVEDYGDWYNIRVMKDDDCDPLIREISRVHHMDEARHLAFDRAFLTELSEQYLQTWDEAQLTKFRTWLAGFMKANWATFYNPAVYKDAGLENVYELRRMAMASPAQKALREKVSAGLIKFFLKIGLLAEVPEV